MKCYGSARAASNSLIPPISLERACMGTPLLHVNKGRPCIFSCDIRLSLAHRITVERGLSRSGVWQGAASLKRPLCHPHWRDVPIKKIYFITFFFFFFFWKSKLFLTNMSETGGNPFGIYEWWDGRQTCRRVTEYRGCRKWNMQMRCAGFKAAVCLIAALWHCLPMMDGGFHGRGPLVGQILWFMITHDLWLWVDVRAL